MVEPAPGLPDSPPTPGQQPQPRWREPRRAGLVVIAAVCCLTAAIVAGTLADASLTRPPTRAEQSAAAATAIADRWRTWPAGRIFPADLGYTTSLRTQETASRAGISPAARCSARIDAALGRLARRDACQAAIAATYVDELQGVVFTIGVLAFGSTQLAARFSRGMPASAGRPVAGIRAQAFPGTASAAFSDPARQSSTVTQHGPYVILTASGYADGRPAAVTGERDNAVFAPAAQLASEIAGPLTAPAAVDCADQARWSC